MTKAIIQMEKIKKILNIPVVIFSVPGLSQAGYVGRSTDEILKQVYYDADEDINLAERAIIILDEIDKIASRGDGAVSTSGVQNELLKIIEGCTRYIESNFTVSSVISSTISFVTSSIDSSEESSKTSTS